MKNISVGFVVLCVSALLTVHAHALTLSFDPSSQMVASGGTTTVDLNISGLGNFAATSLGAFLVEVTFDDSLLTFDSVSYGALLGDPLDFFETAVFTTVGVGSVSLDEISFLFDFELDALQPDSFTLATLSFTGDNEGISALGFGTVDLSDAAFPASTLTVDQFIGASITVESSGGAPQPVPEPSTWLLFGTGMIGLLVYKRQRNRKLGSAHRVT